MTMRLKKARTFRIILFALACNAFVAGLSRTIPAERQREHSHEKIDIEILNCESKYDDINYYVYTNFSINNNTSAALDYVEVVASFRNASGADIGTMTGKFGSVSGSGLNLEKGQGVIQETYLSERQSAAYHDGLFVELFNNGLRNVTVTYTVTYAKWTDGYTYYGK